MRAGADPYQPSTDEVNLGYPAQMAMAATARPDNFEVMLKEGLDVNGGLERNGLSLVANAVRHSTDRRLRQLIATGKLDVNVQDEIGDTPLIDCVDMTQYGYAHLLLDAGANPRLGTSNVFRDLMTEKIRWDPKSTKGTERQRLIERLRAMGMTESTVTKPARVRPLAPGKE
jgi:hypothetical protein